MPADTYLSCVSQSSLKEGVHCLSQSFICLDMLKNKALAVTRFLRTHAELFTIAHQLKILIEYMKTSDLQTSDV